MTALAHTAWPGQSGRIRILVADDSAVVRGLVSRWLTESGHFDLVGTAANGRLAVEAVEKLDPDIVLLDVEMPELDGIGALQQILRKKPGVSVVMFSTLTQRNAETSLKCLSLGAVDYVPKPEAHRLAATSGDFRAEFIDKLRHLAPRRLRARAPEVPARAFDARPAAPVSAPLPKPVATRPRVAPTAAKALLIGASTGGPKAVMEVMGGLLPVMKRVPTLVVQHMPPVFTAVFAGHLATHTGLPAEEAKDGEALQPGRIYVAPGGRHMGLKGDRAHPAIRLDDGPAVSFCRPAVDVLFRDAAQVFGGACVALVLTGMGSDGTAGARSLVEVGVPVIVQDEATSTVWGMPGSIAKAGLAQDVLPLDAIAPAVRAQILGGLA